MMEITNWASFYRLLITVFLMIVAVIQSMYTIKENKIYTPLKVIIWGLISICAILDCTIHFLLSTTNAFSGHSYPILFQLLIDMPVLVKILIGLFLVLIYLIYFQWNIVCKYKIGNKDIPLTEQLKYKKCSAYVMYIVLIFHLIFYAMFFRTILFF